ncbi:hypothetical protein BOTBODRAFT_34427 [Botryobasidium botryosum FD-172 SS1]|uniref:Uncharacterized protein n=1 Tax=Botryobasidium botryosum (strain FD-172 SS1) TaxID=930990 RepID=A0A067MCM5_BOTB1|nr:hypothetical protein BOTBODRAFT_34427 [Botryobasidium botryosum FD-172 SS1]
MRPFASEPWRQGAKIVIGFDIGTTQTAVSFTYLYPGGLQSLHRVVQWPGQENDGGEAKIPSLVWYDSSGQACAFGAEARTPEVLDKAEDEEWRLAQHFKLHLHPASSTQNADELVLDPLPFGVTIEQIYADFMGYIFRQTEKYFKERIMEGETKWSSLEDSIELVVAHPNGWDIREQGVLRNATVDANIMPSLYVAQERVHFVSEAEAAVHFVLLHADFDNGLKVSDDFVVCDAGGSTVDTTLYSVDETEPLIRLKEKRASACVQAGAIFVNQAAKEHFARAFAGAGLGDEAASEFTSAAMESFEASAKRRFEDPAEDKIISVGGRKFTNAKLSVRRGSMTVAGAQLQQFFDPSVKRIIESVTAQIEGHAVKYILLVGGFGESPYLRQKLRDGPGSMNGIKVTIAEQPTSKAVADGAVIWFVRHAVTARATRYAFGTPIMIPTGHAQGERMGGRKVIDDFRGSYFGGAWKELVPRGQILDNSADIRSCTFFGDYGSETPDLGSITVEIYVFEGTRPPPAFILDRKDNIVPGFRLICEIEADLSGLSGTLARNHGPKGAYWTIEYSIALKFGGTELRASLVWIEKGVMRRGPASIIPVSQI